MIRPNFIFKNIALGLIFLLTIYVLFLIYIDQINLIWLINKSTAWCGNISRIGIHIYDRTFYVIDTLNPSQCL